jgi:ribosomal protein S18 acetylase RimI-like enzyme
MPEIQTRPTIASDIPYLIKIDHSTSSESVWQLELRRDTEQIIAAFREVRLPRSIKVTYPRPASELAGVWSRKPAIFTALVNEIPVGYIGLEMSGASTTAAWASDFAVNVPNRRQGIGGALLLAAQKWAVEKSCYSLTIETQSKNLPAIRLAQKFGYEFCGYNDHYYATQDVALFFAKTLK